MAAIYHREDELQRRINAFICDAFALPDEDYYARMNLKHLLSVKSALSDINNILTMRLTLSFLSWAARALTIDAADIQKLRDIILGTKPSTNGYDIRCDGPIPFVAEVKCNVPINRGTKYGSAQRNGIVKDINSLMHGKAKARAIDPISLKFMVFVDLQEVRVANQHFFASNAAASCPVHFLAENEVPNNPDVVYGIYAKIGTF
ncbi:MAG: hypothetical protein ACAH17_00690 [Candidatus Paceibacterota bacterium]